MGVHLSSQVKIELRTLGKMLEKFTALPLEVSKQHYKPSKTAYTLKQFCMLPTNPKV
jgi:hypothetical protein